MTSSEREAQRRRAELQAMQERAVAEREANQQEMSPEEQHEGEELTSFLRTVKTDKEKRKHQLKLIKELYEDPSKLNFDGQLIPCSSTPEEIADRKQELQYRIDILRAVLAMTEGEMQMLSRAGSPDARRGDTAEDKSES